MTSMHFTTGPFLLFGYDLQFEFHDKNKNPEVFRLRDLELLGRFELPTFTPRSHGFAGTPDLRFNVLRTG